MFQLISRIAPDPLTFFVYSLIALLIIGTIIAVHEFAHAFTANKLGDPTAAYQGRLTLNPFAHLDPLGTIAILFIGMGWGKPTPFNPWNLKNPRRDSALISLSGPVSNFLLAILLTILFRFFPNPFIELLIELNLALGIFNLLPIFPLDGFKVVAGVLPRELAIQWEALERYGLIILLMALIPFGGTSLIGLIVYPALSFLKGILLVF